MMLIGMFVIKIPGYCHFLAEPVKGGFRIKESGMYHLDGSYPVQFYVMRLIDNAHASLFPFGKDLVPSGKRIRRIY